MKTLRTMRTLRTLTTRLFDFGLWTLGFGLGIWVLGLVSCRTPEPVIIRDVRVEKVTETLRDTVVNILPDSASMQALLKCDSLGNVYMDQITELELGKNVKPKIRLVNNTITLDCIVDSLAVYVTWKERYTAVSDSVTTVLPAPRESNFSKAIASLRAILWLVLIIAVVVLVIKFSTPLKGVLKWLKRG